LCQYDKSTQKREELVGGPHPKKAAQKNGGWAVSHYPPSFTVF